MTPVELDGVNILIIDGNIGTPKTNVIIEGIGSFDGEEFFVVDNHGIKFKIEECFWSSVGVPLTGVWKKKFPNSDIYLKFRS